MSIPKWPRINFRAKQGSGSYLLSDGKGKIASSMDNGSTRIRRRFTAILSLFVLTLELDYNELAVFEYFYLNEIKDGSLWFYMPVQRGEGYEINLVRFTAESQPSVAEVGFRRVEVSINVTARNLSLISKEVYDYFATVGIEQGVRLFTVTDEYVNDRYPSITSEYR